MPERIVAHYMDGRGFERALQSITSPEVTPAYVYGQADEEGIRAMRAEGVVVERLERHEPPRRRPAPPIPRRFASRLLIALARRQRVADGPVAERDVWVVRLAGPPLPQWQAQLRDAQIVLDERLGDHDHLAWLSAKDRDRLHEMKFVIGTRRYSAAETLDSGELFAHPFKWLFRRRVEYELLLHPGAEYDSLERALVRRGIGAVMRHGAMRARVVPSPRRLAWIARLPEVASLHEHVLPTASNDRVRALVAVDMHGGGLTGAGQIVAIADTGLDGEHPDFAGRLIDPVPGDPNGHGTHVAATIAGTGAASGGQYRGVAPGAHLVADTVLNSKARMHEDVSITEVLQQAYAVGARIHNDSWSVRYSQSAYREASERIDDFAAEHPDMLIVVAAGNSAVVDGRVKRHSLDAPATARNALTVGASRSDRTGGMRWSEWEGQIEAPLGDEAMSGDAQRLAAISGRGPCDDGGRLKPDLVAPGTLICSARASGVKPGRLGVTPDGRYAYDVGTSMATAVVSGCAALVREHLAATGHAEPSAALVKAILINGANPLTGSDATADPRGDPNYNQGFGAVCMTTSIPGPGVPELRLEFRDEDPARELAQSGECFSYELEADPNLPLRICLVWTDRALRVRGVQNALDLTVTHEPTEMQWLGNQGRPTFWPEEHDHTNNAQRVVITGVEPGTYTIRVGGYSLTDRTQPFALVVSGALRPPGLLDR